MLEELFDGTRSWAKIKTLPLEDLVIAREKLWQKLEGRPYTIGATTEEGAIPF